MNNTEMERLVATALAEHAEKTMNQTDTRTELDRLIIGSQQQERRRRNSAITIAVAAVAVVSAVVAWWPGVYAPDSVPDPAKPVVQLNASEQLAADFVAAYAAFDRELMASYLADDAYLTLGTRFGDDGWILNNRFDEARGYKIQPERCYETQGLQPDGARVGCLFSYHALGSQELGRGPYRDGHFNITVHNGRVSDASASWAEAQSGFDAEMSEPFSNWLKKAYPDAQRLDAWSDRASTRAEVDQSLERWTRLVAEYVAAVQAGETK